MIAERALHPVVAGNIIERLDDTAFRLQADVFSTRIPIVTLFQPLEAERARVGHLLDVQAGITGKQALSVTSIRKKVGAHIGAGVRHAKFKAIPSREVLMFRS